MTNQPQHKTGEIRTSGGVQRALPTLKSMNFRPRVSEVRDNPAFDLCEFDDAEISGELDFETGEVPNSDRGSALVTRSFIDMAIHSAGGWKGAPMHLRSECGREAFYRLAEHWGLEYERDAYGDVCFRFGGGEIPELVKLAQKLYRKRLRQIAEVQAILEQ